MERLVRKCPFDHCKLTTFAERKRPLLAKAKGTILAELKRIERTDLLILDDFGIQPFDSQSRVTLLDIIVCPGEWGAF